MTRNRNLFSKRNDNEQSPPQNGGWEDFIKLLKRKATKLALKPKNYSDSFKCPICKKITILTFFTSFRIFLAKNRTLFIVFHSRCAFKKKRFLFNNIILFRHIYYRFENTFSINSSTSHNQSRLENNVVYIIKLKGIIT